MINYKYSFLALIFALSTASYSTAYDFSPDTDKDVCPETCTPKTKRHSQDEERNPLTLGQCVKAALFTACYWYYLENVPGRVETRCGESAKEILKVVPFVVFAKPLKEFVQSCNDTFENIVDSTLRSVC